MGKFKEIFFKANNLKRGEFVYKNKKKIQGRNGTMYYLFFNDGFKSYRTCIDTTYRNYQNWHRFIQNAQPGDIAKGLVIKGNNMIDADSTPRYGGSLYSYK